MFGFGGAKVVVGLDIGSWSVKAVELERRGDQISLLAAGRARIESPELVEDTVAQVLETAGIKSKRAVTAVSGRSVIVRYVPMAAMPDDEMRAAIRYEADKYIPFDVEQVVLDCQRVEDPGDMSADQIKVVLVAAEKTVIEQRLDLLDRVGLTPVAIEVDAFSLGNAFELRNVRLGQDDNEIRGLLDIGAMKTNICVMRGNSILFTREIYMAGNDMTEAVAKRFGEDPAEIEDMKLDPGGALETMQDAIQPVLEDIATEVTLSLDYFEGQIDQRVKEVYVSGGSALFPGIDQMLSTFFNLETRVWNATEALDITNPRFDPSLLEGTNSDLAVAVGLASRLRGS